MLLAPEDQHRIQLAHAAGQTVVLATGVFDLLHQEHVNFLRKAKAAGDFLVVGIESDTRVRQMKGPTRPIRDQATRLHQVQALGFVDVVFVLPEQFSQPADHRQLLAEVRPNILAISSHTAHQDAKKALLEEFGGQLQVVHQHNPAISTTILLSQNKLT